MDVPQPLPHIAALPRYVPGARGAGGGLPPIKVSSNENPLPPLPSVAAAIARAGGSANRYPDMFAVALKDRLADAVGVPSEQIVLGGGSVAVLAHILQCFAGVGDEVVFAWRSFEAYPILTRLTGAAPVTVPLDPNARHDLARMAAAVTERTKVVMVCSPNNPTGPAVGAEEFAQFMKAIPGRVLVILDEAYVEFVTDPQAVSGAELIGRYDNLVLLRTFSKAYGLAGLRVGYAIAPERIASAVQACVTPFSISAVAQGAALASLDAEAELLERVGAIVAQRDRVASALAAQGWSVPASEGNFVWIPGGELTDQIATHLTSREPAILARPFVSEGLRITIGAREENDQVVAALALFPHRV